LPPVIEFALAAKPCNLPDEFVGLPPIHLQTVHEDIRQWMVAWLPVRHGLRYGTQRLRFAALHAQRGKLKASDDNALLGVTAQIPAATLHVVGVHR
jgi:hypothetical protein